MSPLTNILISLYGKDFYEDFEEHLALLKEINDYRRHKRAEIEEQSKVEFVELANRLRRKYSDICLYFNDAEDWSYFEWFEEIFIKDYDKALIEVEEQNIPSDRELCILRLAREAAHKDVIISYLLKFCREYLTNNTEYSIFWAEYYFTNIQ